MSWVLGGSFFHCSFVILLEKIKKRDYGRKEVAFSLLIRLLLNPESRVLAGSSETSDLLCRGDVGRLQSKAGQ